MNIREATEEWVDSFYVFPMSLIQKAYFQDGLDDIYEVTPVAEGDIVWSYELDGEREVLDISRELGEVTLLDGTKEFKTTLDEIVLELYDFLPMWGTMWMFGDSADQHWIEDEGNMALMADAGFRIYDANELGYIFGIDGAGYNFYEAHWIPLYKKRGLKWHTRD